MIDDDGEVVGREQEKDHHLNYTNSCNFFLCERALLLTGLYRCNNVIHLRFRAIPATVYLRLILIKSGSNE